MQIVVVTKVPEPESGGNMAVAGFDLYWATGEKVDYLDKVEPFVDFLKEALGDKSLGFILNMRAPVFNLGEVLILGDSGREIGYPGRKPSKWDVEVTEVPTLEAAELLSQQTMYPVAEEAKKEATSGE